MSANKIKLHSTGGYNYYTICADGKKYVIGGVPERYAAEYAETAEGCNAVILLTSKPEFTGGMEELLRRRPDIEVYGGSAALRNIKEIVNRDVNEKLIKDGMEENGLLFCVTPGLDWVDTVMVIFDGILFSGQAFSGFDGSAVGLKEYYESRLAVNRGFVVSALDRLCGMGIAAIYPAQGLTCPQGSVCISATADEVFAKYREWTTEAKRSRRSAAVLYASEYGYTKALADHAAQELGDMFDVSLIDAKDTESAIKAINGADVLAIGTRTENRNAPGCIWDVITRIDLVNKRGMPYFVFGSFGWAGDGIKLVDKTLASMGLIRAAKPVEVLFRPSEKDMEKMNKAIKELKRYEDRDS